MDFFQLKTYFKVCKMTVGEDDVMFAVKTFSGYHNSRIVVVKRTWAKDTKHIRYFSDVDDMFVPTITFGINNTERGELTNVFERQSFL